MGTFGSMIDQLIVEAERGPVRGGVAFRGPHAVAHHEFPERGPESWEGKARLIYTTPGTGPNYLGGPAHELHAKHLQMVAQTITGRDKATGRYVSPKAGMTLAMEDLRDAARRRVPRLTGDLASTAFYWSKIGRGRS